jgi:hypothetical protein
MNPLDLLSWGYIQDKMVSQKVTLLQQLKRIILEVIHDTEAYMATDELQVECIPSNKHSSY